MVAGASTLPTPESASWTAPIPMLLGLDPQRGSEAERGLLTLTPQLFLHSASPELPLSTRKGLSTALSGGWEDLVVKRTSQKEKDSVRGLYYSLRTSVSSPLN